ncbi:hypothetical protein [Streptomyces sp. ME19-01-6]|uniref:hypothetical protein n=1 Tax=Streptomyces sp. ME19-01-6 TaxID=3028686 RepID=UPI0029B0D872|nr:hypothetical protein [Streptomyces sp. ME19-01-6]MDX3233554.1 hypothetical protein [Streptomyces sp. ME19-01-6]
MWVAVGAGRRDLDRSNALAGKHGVEGGGELRVPVADEVGAFCGAIAELPQKPPGLLSDPYGGGMGCDAEDVDGAGTHLHDEQRVEPLQADGVDMEEIGGKQAAGLGFEEGSSLTARRLVARAGPGPAARSTRRTVAG